jgi:pimeloyl-ACP methyl ester carboxylesterase
MSGYVGRVKSRDGTRLSYSRYGRGEAVILVGGGLDVGTENEPLAVELGADFSVYNFARRGRGDSGDTLPYAIEREFEDLEALITEAGGSAYLYGVSSGGALALEVAAVGLPIAKVAVYEVPYDLTEDTPSHHRAYIEQLEALLAQGRSGDALAHFMRYAGSSDADIVEAKNSPMWTGLEPLAPTLLYDAICLGDRRPPTDRLARIAVPTLVATGGASPFEEAADAIAASIPNGRRSVIAGQSHIPDPKAVAAHLTEFFRS